MGQIEEQLWKQLSIEYMSEDESDALVDVVHQRSKRKICYSCAGLTDFLFTLHEQYNRKDGTAMARKLRFGSASSSRPPHGAPPWGIDSPWTGIYNATFQ